MNVIRKLDVGLMIVGIWNVRKNERKKTKNKSTNSLEKYNHTVAYSIWDSVIFMFEHAFISHLWNMQNYWISSIASYFIEVNFISRIAESNSKPINQFRIVSHSTEAIIHIHIGMSAFHAVDQWQCRYTMWCWTYPFFVHIWQLCASDKHTTSDNLFLINFINAEQPEKWWVQKKFEKIPIIFDHPWLICVKLFTMKLLLTFYAKRFEKSWQNIRKKSIWFSSDVRWCWDNCFMFVVM